MIGRVGKVVNSWENFRVCSDLREYPSMLANVELVKRMVPSWEMASTATGIRSSTTSAGKWIRVLSGD